MAALKTIKIAVICALCLLLIWQHGQIKALQIENESLALENAVLKKAVEQKTQAVQSVNAYQADLEKQLFETQQRLNLCLQININTDGYGSPLKNGGSQKPPTSETGKTANKLITLYNTPL